MEILKVKWHKRSQKQFDKITSWYFCNMGAKAAIRFAEDVSKTVNLISHSPHIGILDERRSTDKLKYYSILIHPKYRVIYRFTETNLYIVAIRATMMKCN